VDEKLSNTLRDNLSNSFIWVLSLGSEKIKKTFIHKIREALGLVLYNF
jgi:hypothetical protein